MGRLKAAAVVAVFVVAWVLVLLLFVDALEYETYGECRDCLLLDKVRPGLAE